MSEDSKRPVEDLDAVLRWATAQRSPGSTVPTLLELLGRRNDSMVVSSQQPAPLSGPGIDLRSLESMQLRQALLLRQRREEVLADRLLFQAPSASAARQYANLRDALGRQAGIQAAQLRAQLPPSYISASHLRRHATSEQNLLGRLEASELGGPARVDPYLSLLEQLRSAQPQLPLLTSNPLQFPRTTNNLGGELLYSTGATPTSDALLGHLQARQDLSRTAAVLSLGAAMERPATTAVRGESASEPGTSREGSFSTATHPESRAETQTLSDEAQDRVRRDRTYRHETFPVKLYRILEEANAEGNASVISFTSTGTAIKIHLPQEFAQDILPRYFRHNHLSSFKRLLRMYGFRKITGGVDKGAFAHRFFVRGRPELCEQIKRTNLRE